MFMTVLKCSCLYWNVHDCIEMFMTVLKCSWLYWNVHDCIEMFMTVLKCSWLYWNVHDCIEMFMTVLKCSWLYWNVHDCIEMFMTVLKCSCTRRSLYHISIFHSDIRNSTLFSKEKENVVRLLLQNWKYQIMIFLCLYFNKKSKLEKLEQQLPSPTFCHKSLRIEI